MKCYADFTKSVVVEGVGDDFKGNDVRSGQNKFLWRPTVVSIDILGLVGS